MPRLARRTFVAFLFVASCKRSKPIVSTEVEAAAPIATAPPAAPPTRPAKHPRTSQSSAADKKAWASAMKAGRAAFRKKDFAAAVRAFDKANDVFTDEPQTLSELGWAAFNDKDYTRAEEATRSSLEHYSTTENRGATFYNLGRIEEERGDSAAAIEAYEKSLTVRPNAVVIARLRKLDARRADAFAPFAFLKTDGPYASMTAVCAHGRAAREEEANYRCDPKKSRAASTKGPLAIKTVTAPYQAVFLHSSEFSEETPIKELTEADEIEERFFITAKVGERYFKTGNVFSIRSNMMHNFAEVEIKQFDLVDVVAGGAPEIVLRWESSEGGKNGFASDYGSETEYLQICSLVDNAKSLACTVPTLLGQVDSESTFIKPGTEDDDEPTMLDEAVGETNGIELEFEWAPPASISVKKGKVTGKGSLSAGMKLLLGTHELHPDRAH